MAFPLIFFAGWGLLAGYMLPLPSPSRTPEAMRAFYIDHSFRIRLGLIITVGAAALQIPFASLISVHLRRIEGEHSPLPGAQMLCGAVNMILIAIPMFIFAAAAYRPTTRPLDTTVALNDLA